MRHPVSLVLVAKCRWLADRVVLLAVLSVCLAALPLLAAAVHWPLLVVLAAVLAQAVL